MEGVQPLGTPKRVSRKNALVETPFGFIRPSKMRLVAAESKATKRPSGLMEGEALAPLASIPSGPTDRRVVAGVQPDETPIQVSRRKMSATPLASPMTRLFASEANATNRPFALIDGERLAPFGSVPSKPTETRVVAGVHPAGAP